MSQHDEMRKLINLVEGIFSKGIDYDEIREYPHNTIEKYVPRGMTLRDMPARMPAHLKKLSTTQLKELYVAAYASKGNNGLPGYYEELSDLVKQELLSRGEPLQFSPSVREPDGEPSSYQPPDGGISGEVRTRDRTPREKENLRGAEAQWRIRQLGQNPFRRPN